MIEGAEQFLVALRVGADRYTLFQLFLQRQCQCHLRAIELAVPFNLALQPLDLLLQLLQIGEHEFGGDDLCI